MLCVLAAGLAVAPHAAAQQPLMHRYGRAQGLSHERVLALAQDARGFVWVGSERGLDRLDGRDARAFTTLLGNRPMPVLALLADGDRRLFAGGAHGLSCITLSSTAGDRLDTSLTALLRRLPAPVSQLAWDADGGLLVRAAGSPWKVQLARRTIAPLDAEPGPFTRPSSLLPDTRAWAVDGRGRVWEGGPDGLRCVDGSTVRLVGMREGLPDADVRAVLVDREGNVWAGTGRGAAVFTPGRAERPVQPDGQPLPASRALATASDGSMWMLPHDGGIARYDGSLLRRFGSADGVPGATLHAVIAISAEQAMAGGDAGVLLYADGRWRRLTRADGLPSDTVRALCLSSRGGCWIGTDQGLAHWGSDGITVLGTAEGLPSPRVTAVAENRYGDVWVGTDAGACVLTRSARYSLSLVDPLRNIVVTSVFIDRRNAVWFATATHGALLLHDGRSAFFTRAAGLPSDAVDLVAQDMHGAVYLGTPAGVCVLQEAAIDYFLPASSHFWNQPAPMHLPFLRRRSVASLDDALAPFHASPVDAVARDSGGTLWFAGAGGVLRYRPLPASVPGRWRPDEREEGGRDAAPLHRILLTDLQAGLDARPVRDVIELDADDPMLVARCVLPTFRSPAAVRYFYQLEGLEHAWHESADGRILYTGLRPGSYALLVQATIGDGIWLESRVILRVNVPAPFTDSGWFRGTLALVLLAAVVLWRRARLRERTDRTPLPPEKTVSSHRTTNP